MTGRHGVRMAAVMAFLACATPGSAQDAAAPSPSVPPQGFGEFLRGVERDAVAGGIRDSVVRSALADVQHIDRVIELDRKQPEFTFTFEQYLGRIASPERVAMGRKMMAENKALLDRIAAAYGVQPRFVVALWGIESRFGQAMGDFPTVASLATLAYDGRRSAYFRGELINALRILDQGHIAPADMKGSWAGAMGQCQFMPSSFLKFAQDGNGDGRRDIWTTRADVLASAANYLSQSGWRKDEGWGRAVQVPARLNASLYGLDTRKSVDEWSRLGVRLANGQPLPKGTVTASLIRAEGDHGPAYLVYENYRTILKWNRSTFFALTVGHLADRIASH